MTMTALPPAATKETAPEIEPATITLGVDELQAMLDQQRQDILNSVRAEQQRILSRGALARFGMYMGGAAVCISVLLVGVNEVIDNRTAGVADDLRALRTEASELNDGAQELNDTFGNEEGIGELADRAEGLEHAVITVGEGLGVDMDEPLDLPDPSPCEDFDPRALTTASAAEFWCPNDR